MKRHHKDAPDGFPCSCGKPVDDPIHLPSTQAVTAEEILAESAEQIFENWKADQPTGEWTTRGIVDTPVPHIRITPEERDQIIAALAAATARELHSYHVAKKCRDELAVVLAKVADT